MRANSAQAAGWYVITGQTFSNPHYKVETVQSTVPTESQSWGSLKAEYR
ncbi:MAG: hypothetical protein IPH86_15730 [bacterium]|nr:hypothetical protein [bacterium]